MEMHHLQRVQETEKRVMCALEDAAAINPYSALCLPAGRVPKTFSSPKHWWSSS